MSDPNLADLSFCWEGQFVTIRELRSAYCALYRETAMAFPAEAVEHLRTRASAAEAHVRELERERDAARAELPANTSCLSLDRAVAVLRGWHESALSSGSEWCDKWIAADANHRRAIRRIRQRVRELRRQREKMSRAWDADIAELDRTDVLYQQKCEDCMGADRELNRARAEVERLTTELNEAQRELRILTASRGRVVEHAQRLEQDCKRFRLERNAASRERDRMRDVMRAAEALRDDARDLDLRDITAESRALIAAVDALRAGAGGDETCRDGSDGESEAGHDTACAAGPPPDPHDHPAPEPRIAYTCGDALGLKRLEEMGAEPSVEPCPDCVHKDSGCYPRKGRWVMAKQCVYVVEANAGNGWQPISLEPLSDNAKKMARENAAIWNDTDYRVRRYVPEGRALLVVRGK